VPTKQKICVVTGTRAEYGLLYWLMKELLTDPAFDLQLVVTGMHLSPEFGLTYRQVLNDGFRIDKKVEILLSSDTPCGIAKSMGLALIGFADVFQDLKPDMVVVLGDRYEIFAAVSAATVAQLPVAHLHGGETTEGAFDEAFRHSITKMSHLHFTATEEYRRRVIQLGEQPDRVFNVGGLGIDNIKRLQLLDRDEFSNSLDLPLGLFNYLVTFHPVTLESVTAGDQFQQLLQALEERPETHLIFTKANADTDGRIINHMIDDYVAKHRATSIAYDSLGQVRYLSALQFVDAVVGNSSSGLLEAPSFKIATVNIGDRQKGRIKASSVIDCLPVASSIAAALKKAHSPEFRNVLKSTVNPYGEGGASVAIKEVLKMRTPGNLLKKKFYDLKQSE
jgi:GDP/UDP-N,N'-diacetylbacillosamine 2-epimerase (hydrolysing)